LIFYQHAAAFRLTLRFGCRLRHLIPGIHRRHILFLLVGKPPRANEILDTSVVARV
jgi:hypothetical protein